MEAPDAVFVGGGLTTPLLVETCWDALPAGGRLVANAVTVESEAVLARWHAEVGGELVRVEVQRAEPLDGPAIAWARETARELGIDLVAGSISERIDGEDKLRNTSLHIGPDGEIKATYRKIHMFDVEVGGRTYFESGHEAPGDEIVASELADGSGLGLTICYDLRFPELSRILAVRGATVLTVPAGTRNWAATSTTDNSATYRSTSTR